jgi:hypothetical protein
MQIIEMQMWIIAGSAAVVAAAVLAVLAMAITVGQKLNIVLGEIRQLVATSERTMDRFGNELSILAPVSVAVSGISKIVSIFMGRKE